MTDTPCSLGHISGGPDHPSITIEVNGDQCQAVAGLTVARLVAAISVDGENADLTVVDSTVDSTAGIGAQPTADTHAAGDGVDGYAVAVNDEIVPASTWRTSTVRDGDRIEILTAVQGG
ncbi:sulfur carrier protein ThiS [Corynebacterium kroppenstedtii]|uniref:sulfur carrier protein ThiS n=1 Tax=Corynebacterium sp. PCR 32 TaxID=3351342 RepID=UPI0030B46382